ncbi:hypothetical protein [Rhizobium rhizogenes]|uniref:hypothetical protein n=1 Tax=Rhizobium rhizogenes TaxID=359 RepID=UPI00124731DD
MQKTREVIKLVGFPYITLFEVSADHRSSSYIGQNDRFVKLRCSVLAKRSLKSFTKEFTNNAPRQRISCNVLRLRCSQRNAKAASSTVREPAARSPVAGVGSARQCDNYLKLHHRILQLFNFEALKQSPSTEIAMRDLKNFFLWRKTWTLVALVVLMSSSVFSLAASSDLPTFWSICAAGASTIMLFLIAFYDWIASAGEAADYAELNEQVRQMEARINRLEANQLAAAE